MTRTKNEIKKLFENIDETKETLLVLHIDENDNFSTHFCGEKIEIAAGIATVVYDGMKSDAEDDIERLAKAIVDGVAYTMEDTSLSAIKVMLRLTKAIIKSRENIGKELADKLGIDNDNDAPDSDNDDGDENCEECENNRWCPLPNAIKYRKENNIPAPKKRKGVNRHGGHKKD